MTHIKKILHPTDFSEQSGYAFRVACALARDFGARLILLHVQPLPTVAPAGVMSYQPELPEESNALRERLYSLRPEDPRIAVARYLVAGDEAGEIVRLAEGMGCDLVVMGTHGRTGLGWLLMGSVAEQVLRTAPCPVLTVRDPFPQAETPATPAAEERWMPVAVG